MAKTGTGLLASAALVVVAAGIFAARPLLTPILLSTLISMATVPLMNWMRRHRVPDMAAIALVIVLALCALVLFGTLVGTSLNVFVARLPRYVEQLTLGMQALTAWLAGHGMVLSSELVSELVDPAPILSIIARLLQGLAQFLSMALLVLIVVVFMLMESLGLRAKLVRVAISPRYIKDLENASKLVDRYLVVKTVASVVTGGLVSIWTAALGLELPVLWGVLAFVLNYVPTIGSIVAAVPAVALGMLQLGPGMGLLLALGYLAINTAIGNGLEPRAMGAALGISPLVVFFSLLLWGFLLGPVGALVSVPLTVVVRIYLASVPELAWIAVLLGPTHEDDVSASVSLPPAPNLRADAPAAGDLDPESGESNGLI